MFWWVRKGDGTEIMWDQGNDHDQNILYGSFKELIKMREKKGTYIIQTSSSSNQIPEC